MLNKNQSDKRNSWKYFVVLPLLAFFMFQFQMRVLAQEKQAPKIEKRETTKKVISVVIDKNTTDAEMKKDAEMLKNDFGVTLKVSKVKRNSNAEITGIKVDFKDKDGRKGTTQMQSDSPIQPIRFFKEMDETGKATAIGFGRPSERERRSALAAIPHIRHLSEDGEDIEIIIDGDDEGFAWADNFDFDIEVPELPDGVDAPALPEAADAPSFPRAPRAPGAPGAPRIKGKSVVIKQDGDQKEVWVDGEKIAEDVLNELEAEGIGRVYVYDTKGPKGDKNFFYHDENGRRVISQKEIQKITKEAMEESKIQMKKMRKHMDKMRPEMEKAKIRMREAQPEMEQAREEMLKAKEEMLKAKEELEKAKIELEKAKSSEKK